MGELAINNRDSSATGMSPFFVNHGFHPYLGTAPPYVSNNDRARDFATNLHQAHAKAQTALKKTADRMEATYNERCQDSPEYAPGD